jgi:hypothetical protein
MRIETTTIEKLMITNINDLDPVAVYLEDQGEGKGKITITCYGKAWTAFWGSMGCNVREFIISCDNGYLLRKLDHRVERDVMAYDQTASHVRRLIIEQRRARSITKRLAREYWEKTEAMEDVSCKEDIREYAGDLQEIAGPFWYDGFPTEENDEYYHLNKIVTAVKDALILPLEQAGEVA